LRHVWLAFAFVPLSALPAAAGDLDQPKFAEGDVWLYATVNKSKGAVKEGSVEISFTRAQGDRMLIAAKEPGSTKPPVERLTPVDWSRVRSVNGVETVVNRPLSFPLALGKSWRVDFTEANPSPQFSSEHNEMTYKVVDWETVKTPAGEFKALKIEGSGTWTSEIPEQVIDNSAIAKTAPNAAVTSTAKKVVAAKRVTGRIYRMYYYAPSVKRWVKLLEESYGTSGEVTFSYSEELKDFHPGGA